MMRKIKGLIVALTLVTTLIACGGEDPETTKTDEETTGDQTIVENDTDQDQEDQSVDVDKGLLNVEITLPASLIEEQDLDDLVAEAKAQGIDEVIKNGDGSVTYKMSKAKHQEMMEEIETGILETMNEMKNIEELESISDVTTNSSYSEFTMVVNKEAYESSFDGFAAFGLGISGMFYQLFDGENPDNLKVKVFVEDEETGEVFDTIVYPDDMDF